MFMNTLQFILKNQIKNSKVVQNSGGFTLIELLVSALVAFLIITPLLSFVTSLISTDRREQAKANTEQEIQTALNYIARDLKQAIYIYDNAGVETIKNQIPTGTGKSPILVFWKRELVTNVVPTGTTKDDAFVHSLVAYYLIKDTNTTWSKAARIGRWEVRDGVKDVTGGGVDCPGYTDFKYVSGNCPQPGFASFEQKVAAATNLETGMNSWTKASADYTNNTIVLIDYVDHSTNSAPAATCSPNTTQPPITWSKITPANNMTGFYACVDRANTTAQVFLRGNALARLETNPNNITYSAANSTYFPTTNVRVQGRGFLSR
jgi:type II secretory pathway pseudopilin PulG